MPIDCFLVTKLMNHLQLEFTCEKNRFCFSLNKEPDIFSAIKTDKAKYLSTLFQYNIEDNQETHNFHPEIVFAGRKFKPSFRIAQPFKLGYSFYLRIFTLLAN